MKYCPTCETRYDEDILRFCMKDGTPLVDEEEPNFIAMPSESLDPVEDDPSEVTIVRKSTPIPPPAVEPEFTPREEPAERIVVPTFDEPKRASAAAYRPTEPPRSNTFKVVILTIFGTLFVLTLGALGFWGLQKLSGSNSNSNINANVNLANEDTNVNTNIGMDSNFNFNSVPSFDDNTNSDSSNSNLKTPTPTPSPTPRPSPTPTATPDRDDDDTPTPTPLPLPTRPQRTPFPTPTPTPIIIRPAPPEVTRTPNVRRSDNF